MRNIRADLAGFVLLCALLAGGNAALAAEAAASAAVHPGQALYEKHCSACHDKPDLTRAVPFAQLRNMRLGNLFFAMTDGKMKEQAKGLNERQRGQLVDFIVGRQVVDERWIDAMRCGKDVAAMRLPPEGAANVLGFGFTRDNRRQLTREQAGLSTAEVKDLELAWVLAFPRASTMRAQAAIAGDTLFLPVTDEARVFATDISGDAPCFRWVYTSNVPLRTGVAYGVLPSGRAVIAFADAAVNVHLVDAATGKLIWKTPVGRWDLSNATGTRRSWAIACTCRFRLQRSISAATTRMNAARRMACSPRWMRAAAGWCGATKPCPMPGRCAIAATARCCGVRRARRYGHRPWWMKSAD